MSRAVSARYGVPCPVCKASRLEPCRTLDSGRVTDTHKARIDGYLRARKEGTL